MLNVELLTDEDLHLAVLEYLKRNNVIDCNNSFKSMANEDKETAINHAILEYLDSVEIKPSLKGYKKLVQILTITVKEPYKLKNMTKLCEEVLEEGENVPKIQRVVSFAVRGIDDMSLFVASATKDIIKKLGLVFN